MRFSLWNFASACCLIVCVVEISWSAADKPLQEQRAIAQKEFDAGDFRDAYQILESVLLDPAEAPGALERDLLLAHQCLQRLGQIDRIDDLVDRVLDKHPKVWQAWQAAAQTRMDATHWGVLLAGDEFHRGSHRGGGRPVSSFERDRVDAIQYLTKAVELQPQDAPLEERFGLYQNMTRAIMLGREGNAAWKLQVLTDLKTLPDYDDMQWGYRGRGGSVSGGGAPVDENGDPVYYHVPQAAADAASDGELWRWYLHRAAQLGAEQQVQVTMQRASFLWQQFGVQTLRQFGWFNPQPISRADEGNDNEPSELTLDTSPYALHTLKDTETIAQLATGVRRFDLPDEFNFILLYRGVADSPQNSQAQEALTQLADIYENRRQYAQAADVWRELIRRFGPGSNSYRQKRLDQIVGNWGTFETVRSQAAGHGAEVDLRYRNGRQVQFIAQRIDIEKVLTDLKQSLKSNPKELDWYQLNVENIGYQIVVKNQKQYVGETVADWKVDLDPDPRHVDQLKSITTPLSQAGAYLLTAKMQDGNTSRIVVWIDDTALVQKPMGDRALYLAVDAASGQPIADMNVEFFGYQQKRVDKDRLVVTTSNFAETTDANGLVVPDKGRLSTDHQWMVIARSRSGRLAFLGFRNVWQGNRTSQNLRQAKAFLLTNRPIYRPGQTVEYKAWIRVVAYDLDETSQFAGRKFHALIRNPRGETIHQADLTADEFGGIAGQFELPADAPLGGYSVVIEPTRVNLPGFSKNTNLSGHVAFRVEEYKKPEFEVTIDSPAEPVQLGEKVSAVIRAKYYFGAPVTSARVHYKVLRYEHSAHWYPIGPWDWLFGRGYRWLALDYAWYPGWKTWGCVAPYPIWQPRPQPSPEVVLDAEVPIGPDGEVSLEIDTALAKATHSDVDHRYEITAEVTDESRRTIVGKGDVLVAREPFNAFAWANRGHYRPGDTVTVRFHAQTLDSKPVSAKGKATLYQIRYDAEGTPHETSVETWDIATDDSGDAEVQFKAAAAGQYRLEARLANQPDNGHTTTTAAIILVRGDQFQSADFQFNDLEVIPDKAEYEPGETVRLMINTNRIGSTVALFLRPINGVYNQPEIIRLDGKSTLYELPLNAADMPNIFVEAITVSDGRLHSVVREIVIPPAKRLVNVEITPSAEDYRPGAPAQLDVQVTDPEGRPVAASLAISLYDRALEYISGGSNVTDIRKFFWDWRRAHHPINWSNLERWSANLLRQGETPMQTIGTFGDVLEMQDRDERRGNALQQDKAHFGAMRKSGMADGLNARAMAASAPMEAQVAGGGAGGTNVEPAVRTDFADSAFWTAAITTDKAGKATVRFDMPENLTDWQIRTWGMAHGTRVGEAADSVVTSKNLIVRLQAPRFFTQIDEVTLSANVHNYLETSKRVTVRLELDGGTLQPLDDLERVVEVAAGGEQRIDWRVRATQAGDAVVRVKALTDEESDAVEMTFPVKVHGLLRTESYSASIRGRETSAQLTVDVPAARDAAQSRLEVRYSPSIALALVDALPYLIDVERRTTDAALARFLPAVVTQGTLQTLGVDLKSIRKKVANLNPQEIGATDERRKQWARMQQNPIFNEKKLNRIVDNGVQELTEMQLPDGGWGWLSGFRERSDAHMTAQVVHGLKLAQQNGVAIVPGVLERGIEWLKTYQEREIEKLQNCDSETKPYRCQCNSLDALVFSVLVETGVVNDTMSEFLYRDRTKLPVYALGLFGLALEQTKKTDQLTQVMSNIDQFLMTDDENQTAYLELSQPWWYWYGSEAEANACYLKLLSRREPQGSKTAGLAKYLLNNRKHASYWSNTRDTSLAIEALAEFVVASGESLSHMKVDVLYDGRIVQSTTITPENLFEIDNVYELTGNDVTTGRHTIEVRRTTLDRAETPENETAGPLYFNTYLTTFTQEEFIPAAGLEIKVHRRYYKLVRADREEPSRGVRGQAVGERTERYDRVELVNESAVHSGDLLEVELQIESKNDYEYISITDPKAAGLEPFELRSGYLDPGYGQGLGAYVEYRDDRSVFYVRSLPRGEHRLTYRWRAEIPGRFSALPTQGIGVYAPELNANSDEMKLRIEDQPLSASAAE